MQITLLCRVCSAENDENKARQRCSAATASDRCGNSDPQVRQKQKVQINMKLANKANTFM